MNSDRKFLNKFNHQFEEINRELGKSLISKIPLVREIAQHSILGAGKRLRPLLFVLSSQLCGYEKDDVYTLSTIFEYIHTASLLHDDVLDNAELRRKKPSANQLWGTSAAVLSGDYFYSKSSALAVDYKNLHFLKMITDTTVRMTEGQLLELEQTHNWHISKDDYMEIIISKTAALISATCACGAIIAGADQEIVDHLKDFGMNLGIAFQMMDDILDYTSCEEEFGKPVGKDLREGKITLPLIYTLSKLQTDEVERLRALFTSEEATDGDYSELIDRVRSNGALDRIRSEARDYVERAASALKVIPNSPVKEDLMAINAYLIKRHF